MDVTQDELAERVGTNRSDLSSVENGKRKPSRNMLEALRREIGVSTDWLLYGEGAPPDVLARAAQPRLPDWNRDAKLAGMLGVPAPRPVPIGKAGIRDGVLQRPKAQDAAVPREGRSPEPQSRFGYAGRDAADDLRALAALDEGIRGTNFERLVMDDAFWAKIQPVTGAELEYLREFCAAAGDPPVLHYVVVLEFVRKVLAR